MRQDELVPSSDSWVAVDFETASTRGNPCSVGLACVSRGRVVDRHSWLIRPPVFEFWSFNVALHGITPEMCQSAPGWKESLGEILAIADGRPLVAHNAGFDIGVIRDACDLVGVDWPRLRYACTVVIARHIWPGLSTYSLPFLAAHLGLLAGTHHDAESDAAVAAQIALAALGVAQVATLEELVGQTRVAMGIVEPDLWQGCHSHADGSTVPRTPTAGTVISREHPLFRKAVAFTGALSIPRNVAQQAAVNCGAVASAGVTRHTDYLVTGYQDLTRLAVGAGKSGKLRHAEELQAAGFPIEILTEKDFVQLLDASASDSSSGLRRATDSV